MSSPLPTKEECEEILRPKVCAENRGVKPMNAIKHYASLLGRFLTEVCVFFATVAYALSLMALFVVGGAAIAVVASPLFPFIEAGSLGIIMTLACAIVWLGYIIREEW